MKNLRIAAVCMNSSPRDVEKNLGRIESFVQEASEKGVHIVCFPELSITGYTLRNPEDVYPDSLSEEGIVESVARMSQGSGLVIIAGLIEISNGEMPYITQLVAGPNGLLELYRKTHLSPPEKNIYQAGESIGTFFTTDVGFGLQLCYESHFPEISTVMALKGAEIIFMPHASPWGSPDEKAQSWLRHLPSRAFDNALFVVACNQVGKTREGFSFPGVAMAFNPVGRIIAQYKGNAEHMLLVDLEMDDLNETREHRMRYFIPNRRPELYRRIVD
jgi:N-carbamoylputrescine amidase